MMIWTIEPGAPWAVTAASWKGSASAPDVANGSIKKSASFLDYFDLADRPVVEAALAEAARGGESDCRCRLMRPISAENPAGRLEVVRVGATADEGTDADAADGTSQLVARWTPADAPAGSAATPTRTTKTAAATARPTNGAARVVDDHSVRQFLGTVSHDLRTPLNGVLGMSRLLLDSGLRADQIDYARAIDTSAEQLLSLIEDLLEFATLDTKTALYPVDVDPRALVDEVIASLTSRAAERELEVCALVSAKVPERVSVDASRLRQVLSYVIDDGISRTAVGDVIVRVVPEADARPTAPPCEAAEAEAGASAPREIRLRFDVSVDEPTWADPPRPRAAIALGGGAEASPRAAVCRHLVTLMGGTVETHVDAHGVASHGFTVRVTPRPAPAAALPGRASLAGRRVLCVDDQPVSRRVLLERLRGWHLAVEMTDEAHGALTLMKVASAAGTPFDLVIIDLRLPGVDGFALARMIKSDPALAKTKLILLTGYPARGQAVQAQEVGIDAYLQKPIREAPLRACLDALLNQPDPSATLAVVTGERRYNEEEERSGLRPRVLVAEAHPLNQKVAVQLLEKLGCRVDVVSDGADAVDAICRTPYHLVLMDTQLPSLDGPGATRAVRGRQAHALHPPIVALTADEDPVTRDASLAAGANDVMAKPLRLGTLREKLAQWIDATPPR